ncbi:D-amino-acid transaminase [Desmospora activa]|uniref:D-alanine aminotransferase n=1 Tax=Desmospora activa DSM 45169 TaxID=1121389 RepID=A0A2T4Z9C5_9BACL|nr:D-amino-acid transaminase [Desmospora activa]PTM58492.1 D-alanine transaminase [Desmospora activa DSM 45169]
MILFHDQLTKRENAQVDIEDRGYQFGDGIYEVIRVYNGKAFRLQDHLDRFQRSADEISLQLPYNLERLSQLLQELVQTNQLADGTVYLQTSRGVAPRSHPFPEESHSVIVAYTVEAERPLNHLQNGIRTMTQPDIRWLRCDIKSLNLLGAVLAKQKAKEHGCQESILHRDETVTEGSSTNVFLAKDGQLFTHPANNLILHGITRQVVLELAADMGIPVKEEAFTLQDLHRADEVFITSTTMEITPVIEIDGTPVGDSTPGNLVRRLQAAFEHQI